MVRLLIAEDELWLRRRLVDTIEWEKYGISEIREAEDGAEALRIALNEEPDILITDIRMPELSGVDLMKALNESSVYPKTIVVSGYDDFEYAQKALRLGAVNYLLKPVEEEELLQTVEKCVNDLEKEKKNKIFFDKHYAMSELLIKHIYEDLLFEGTEYNKNSIMILKQFYDEETGIPGKFASVLNIEVIDSGFFENDELKTDIWMAFHCLEKELVDNPHPFIKRYFLYIHGNQIVVLLFSDDLHEIVLNQMTDLEKKFAEILRLNTGYPVVLSSGSIVESFRDVHLSYEESRKKNKSKMKPDDRLDKEGKQELDTNFEDIYADYNYKALIKEIREGHSQQAMEELHILLRTSSRRLWKADTIRLQLFYINLINKIASACLPECENNADNLALQCIKEIKEITSIGKGIIASQIRESLENFIDKLSGIYINNIGNKRHWIMDQVLQYVEENYHTSLSTRDIAQRFYMNASYFSKLFHDQMGCTFSNYLIQIRIEKAKIMLSQTNMKLYDIAYAVGYSNVQYFSTIFKEKEGTTPSRYRQLRTISKDDNNEEI